MRVGRLERAMDWVAWVNGHLMRLVIFAVVLMKALEWAADGAYFDAVALCIVLFTVMKRGEK